MLGLRVRRHFPGYGMHEGRVTGVKGKRFEVTFDDRCAPLHALSAQLRAASASRDVRVCVSHSLTHSLTLSLARSLARSLTHSLTHARTHALTHSFTHSLTHSLTRNPPSAHSDVRSFKVDELEKMRVEENLPRPSRNAPPAASPVQKTPEKTRKRSVKQQETPQSGKRTRGSTGADVVNAKSVVGVVRVELVEEEWVVEEAEEQQQQQNEKKQDGAKPKKKSAAKKAAKSAAKDEAQQEAQQGAQQGAQQEAQQEMDEEIEEAKEEEEDQDDDDDADFEPSENDPSQANRARARGAPSARKSLSYVREPKMTHAKSAYELEREENIRRNNEVLAQLNIVASLAEPKQKRASPAQTAPRRRNFLQGPTREPSARAKNKPAPTYVDSFHRLEGAERSERKGGFRVARWRREDADGDGGGVGRPQFEHELVLEQEKT